MALQHAYIQFLSQPNESFLADDASLHYISSLITIHNATKIVKNIQSNELKIKAQEVLDVVEGTNSLAVETSTTLEFITGGGSYLPSLDDNFLTGRIVTLPITHFVSFTANLKIKQVRLSWDQGSLLKGIDIIGKTGRNWPICEGKDQIKLIASAQKPMGNSNDDSATRFSNNTKGSQFPSVNDQERSISQKKVFPSKSGAGNKFGPSRLFDLEGSDTATPEKSTNVKKFQHFDFAETAEQENKTRPLMHVNASKHGTQWSFDDFMTPQKIVPSKVQKKNEVRHWGNSDDEVIESTDRVKKQEKPRKENERHFELQDEDYPEERVRNVGRPLGKAHNNGLTLYADLFDENNGRIMAGDKTNLPNLSNVKERRKDLEPHFTMTDKSPGLKPCEKISEDRAKSVRMMEANWSSHDDSPNLKENNKTSIPLRSGTGNPLTETTNTSNKRSETYRGIKTDGDGMGGKKGADRIWGFGDDSDGEEEGGINRGGKFATGKQAGKTQALGGDFWDF
ncbi:unnamed protein product [Blumeria hordei]|uniref:Uncharacterized protein n=1 Tax=Blumeria hordei TaxID=2867405 RepID=A0A383UWY6_BLUHO|nr:unnamed protein product [Blumeria hordei]